MGFLATTKDELKGGEPDIVLVTGDAYVDHPSFGAAVIGRVLAHAGYIVGIIAMPDWKNPESIAVLGRPRLFFGVTSGNVDSMLGLYTAFKKRRSDDPYVPGGMSGRKPEHALICYCNLVKARFKDVPVVIGGIEASMRRFVHYDFWDNRLRRSIIEDSRADILAYGMAEASVVEIADRLAANRDIKEIPGTMVICEDRPGDAMTLPPEDETMADKDVLLKTYGLFFRNQDRVLVQKAGTRFIVQYPHAAMSQAQVDEVYALPYMYAPHPSYKEPVPAFDMISGSISAHRGCVSGCSFCSVGLHQGKRIIARSRESILEEARRLTGSPLFKGHVKDIGGPSANMYGYACRIGWKCSKTSCVHPRLCGNLEARIMPWIGILDDASGIRGVSKVTVGSGIRYDLFMQDRNSMQALRMVIRNHISGQLKIAPEHTVFHVLSAMRKTPLFELKEFAGQFRHETEKMGKKQYLLPYLMSCHPGCSTGDMLAMKKDVMSIFGFMPEQVQAFIPLPMTLSSMMFFAGADPLSGSSLQTVKSTEERKRQHSVIVGKRHFKD